MPRSISARDVVRQGTLPFNRKSPGRTVRVRENIVEAETDFELSRFSYHYLNTTTRLKRIRCECPRCHHTWFKPPDYATGQDKGIPDRLVFAANWFHRLLPASLFLGIELKGSHTRFSCDEQKLLHEEGHTVVARSGSAALGAAERVSAFFDYVSNLEAAARRMAAGIRSRNYRESWHAADEAEALLNDQLNESAGD